MHDPAEIGRQLLRLRPRQQRAKAQRMQKPLLSQPVPLLHNLAVHHGDLPGRPAERQQPDPQPHAQRDAKARQGKIWLAHQARRTLIPY
jgi:hypothetical protein